MPVPNRDYFRYFPISPETEHWGLAITGAGFASIAAGTRYPPRQHPTDHYFDWKHGRTLDALQVLLVTAGSGELETRDGGRQRIDAGTAFILLPHKWHRYRPEPQTGWDENWVEMSGPIVEKLLAAGVFAPESILRPGGVAIGLDEAFQEVHRTIREGTAGFDPELSAAALKILALCVRLDSKRADYSAGGASIHKAEQYLSAHHGEPVNIQALAKRLGVGYSHFRREFRTRTGFSPWQYVIHLRLRRARRLLASSDMSLDEVATSVGFNSAFHLSLAFKRAYGQPPSHWRRAMRGSS